MKHILMMLALVFSLSADAQSAETLYKQGKALYDAKNYQEAFPKLKAAAEKGHKKAQYRLGRCYDKGNGTTENDAEAFKWYMKSAAQDYAKALYQVGMCYKDGEGTTKDRQKAVQYFTKAAKLDNADAQYQLGKAYLKGKGIEPDEKKARSWLKKAVSNPKGGDEVLAKIKKDAATGDEDDKHILSLVTK